MSLHPQVAEERTLPHELRHARQIQRPPRLRVALVQQNIDPWRGGYKAYGKSLGILKRQSLEALKQEPEIVIWSEAAKLDVTLITRVLPLSS